MAKITYIAHDGTTHVADANAGFTVMEAAVRNDVPGILAESGGACACATCHVYVSDEWLARAGEQSEMEAAMLDYVQAARRNSRLSCQIAICDALDGLVVSIPETQG